MKRIIIIGGGAAGLMAAGAAAEKENEVIILEKNEQIGKKLLITGKGRCNVTNFSDVKEHIANIKTNGKFMFNCYHQFFVKDLMDFFENRNVPLKIERGNRVFPESDKAGEIVNCLWQNALDKKVKIQKEHVLAIKKKDNIFLVQTQAKKTYSADKIILCTGGVSYPGTGSTGDGLRWAKQFGHTIIPPKPGLVPLLVKEKHIVKKLNGLSLKNVKLKIFDNHNKTIFEQLGEMLFTNHGVSGPLVLSASSEMESDNSYRLEIDFKPGLSEEQLHAKMQRIIKENPKKILTTILKFMLPKLMIPVFIELLKIKNDLIISELTKQDRNRIVFLFKHFQLSLIKKVFNYKMRYNPEYFIVRYISLGHIPNFFFRLKKVFCMNEY